MFMNNITDMAMTSLKLELGSYLKLTLTIIELQLIMNDNSDIK